MRCPRLLYKSVFVWPFFVPALVFAQEAVEEGDAGVSVTAGTVYVGAVVVGIIASVILTRMARANARFNLATKGYKGMGLELEDDIAGSLSGAGIDRETRAEVARDIARTVEQKVSRHVGTVTGQMRGRYEKTIAEKDKQQEIVQVKYKNLVKEKNQTEAIVQSLAEGLVVVNNKGEVVMMNPAAEKLLGVDKKEKIGKSLTEDLSGDEVVSLVRDVKGQGEKIVELDSAQAETKRIIRSSSALVENQNGQTVGMVSVLTDVTKQRELDRLKSQFVSSVTHELRTPLVATQKALDVILTKAAGPINEDQTRFLDIARRNLERLYALINDILDLSKLEAGKMKVEFAPASVEQMVNEVCSSLGSWANSKNIQLVKRVADGLPMVTMDADRIIQVLNNLVSNALKFTPQDGTVTVEAKPRGGGQHVEVSVQDTGIGIAKEDLDRVFEKFLQVGERRQTDVSGTGLGLSIAKEIVERHGGRIWAESEKGQGAKFSFVLPVQPSAHKVDTQRP